MYCQISDFDNPLLEIANLSSDAIQQTVLKFFSVREEQVLEKLLGYDLYKRFKDGINVEFPAQKWLDLQNGADFTLNSVLDRWAGFHEMLKYYIYADFLDKTQSSITPFGVQIFNADNANPDKSAFLKNYFDKRNIGINHYNKCIDFVRVRITEYEPFSTKKQHPANPFCV